MQGLYTLYSIKGLDCYVPITSATSSKDIFAEATNSTNQTNKEINMFH
jgi:hypothetical protein